MVTIRPAMPGDSWLVLAGLRQLERDEFAALGLDPGEQLRFAIAHAEAYTGFIADEPAGVFGVMRQEDGTVLPWGFFTDAIDRHPLAFLRASKRWIESRTESLENEVLARNEKAVDWFRWLGFAVAPPDERGLCAVDRPLVPSRETILALEAAIARDLPPVNLEPMLTHHFAPGLYARELFIPKGTVLTGKIHRCAHLNVISQGDISVLTEQGVRRLKAPCTLLSEPGIKRAGYAHEDTVWTTFHVTPLTDLAEIEAHFIAPSFEALEAP